MPAVGMEHGDRAASGGERGKSYDWQRNLNNLTRAEIEVASSSQLQGKGHENAFRRRWPNGGALPHFHHSSAGPVAFVERHRAEESHH